MTARRGLRPTPEQRRLRALYRSYDRLPDLPPPLPAAELRRLREGALVTIDWPDHENDGRRGVIDWVTGDPTFGTYRYRVAISLDLKPAMFEAHRLRVRHDRDDFWRRPW